MPSIQSLFDFFTFSQKEVDARVEKAIAERERELETLKDAAASYYSTGNVRITSGHYLTEEELNAKRAAHRD